ncbi:MAG: DUF4906 domain-containing protein [Dysgonamonadaceae bacterium]|jgi:hypothetical protein|nr:DUF4906 domain-containing protein [Dysgonamonadaceae bacterium]
MMKRVCKYSLSAIIFSLLTFSCNEGEINENGSEFTGEEREIVFSMNVPVISEAASKFRSISPDQENTIRTIDLLAFRKDNTGSYFDYHYEGKLATGNTPGSSTQNCRINVRLAKYEQELVIITNAGSLIDSIIELKNWRDTSKDDFLSNLEYELPQGAQWKASASDYDALPMWGEISATITQNTSQLSVPLLRMLAKIDVQLDEAKLESLRSVFKLKSVSLYNTRTKGRIVPNSAAVQKSGNNLSVTAPSLPGTSERYLGPIVYRDFSSPGTPDVAMKGAIYTFEAEAPVNGDTLEATCVVVGGLYGTDTSESFYRIDFYQDGTFKDILRNNRYLVNIVSVTGRGYKTSDEAFVGKAVNMSANILIWKDDNMYDVVFDGQWYLSVSRDSILMSREGQDNLELFVKTDYNPSLGQTGWYIDNNIIDNATKQPCTWLIVSPKEGDPNELKNVKISAIENDTGSPRSAVITFVAGRLRYPVTIYQSLLERASITINYRYEPFTEVPGEIIFPITLGQANSPVMIKVDWTPKKADFVAYKTTVAGIPYSLFGVVPNILGVTSGGNDGPLIIAIAPDGTVSQEDVRNEPNYQRAMKLVFSVSNGLNTVEKTVVLKHVYSPPN